MIQIAIMLVVALAGALVIAWLLRGSMQHPANMSQLLDRLQPVDAASFRHLASDVDDRFLRQKLPRSEYRRLRKLRLKAIRVYYLCAFQNSSVLLSYSALLLKNEIPELRLFGQQLSSAAIQLRLALLRGMAGIFVCYITPLGVTGWREIPDLYEQIGGYLNCFCHTHASDLELALARHFTL